MLLSLPRASSDGAWVPDHHAAPDSLPTLTYYSKIGELCGAQPDLERLGAHVVSTWLCSRWPTARRTSQSPTCVSHSRSARSLRRGTTAGSPPSPSTSASLEPLLCPQGSQGVCASLSAHQRQETPTALSAHRQGDWRGGLLAWLRQGFDKSIFSIAPTGQRLKQPQVTDQSSGSCSPPLP
jgi:hypothetical protein